MKNVLEIARTTAPKDIAEALSRDEELLKWKITNNMSDEEFRRKVHGRAKHVLKELREITPATLAFLLLLHEGNSIIDGTEVEAKAKEMLRGMRKVRDRQVQIKILQHFGAVKSVNITAPGHGIPRRYFVEPGNREVIRAILEHHGLV